LTTATSKGKRRVKSPATRALSEGYRSGLEEKIAAHLAERGIEVKFETEKVRFTQPEKRRTYTPDFLLPNGIIIETKGRFLTEDRQKHKWIKAQHPDLDIRFVFSRAATLLSKASPTSYADWCLQYGFQWADKTIPAEWLAEPPCQRRLAAIEKATKK
jgi:hypothetical protein